MVATLSSSQLQIASESVLLSKPSLRVKQLVFQVALENEEDLCLVFLCECFDCKGRGFSQGCEIHSLCDFIVLILILLLVSLFWTAFVVKANIIILGWLDSHAIVVSEFAALEESHHKLRQFLVDALNLEVFLVLVFTVIENDT